MDVIKEDEKIQSDKKIVSEAKYRAKAIQIIKQGLEEETSHEKKEKVISIIKKINSQLTEVSDIPFIFKQKNENECL